ncbi:MAG: glycosyltransferase family 4 protein [Dehalococcoidia bacterium]|nr:glycosyltransferase family 4 protein [Dehalococcoidia bacterium]
MRILQVCPKYYPSIGGIEEHVRNISERLSKEHQVTVFTGDPTGKLPKQEEINGVLVRRFKTFAPDDAYHISFEMARELKKSEFDIVHGHNYHALPLYFARNANAKKFVVTPHYHGHGHTPVRNFLIRLYKSFGRKIFDNAKSIIAVSKYEKHLLLNDFVIDENRVSIIPNGVDLSEFSKLQEVSRELKTILYVGRLEEYKGAQYIIQTLPLLDKDFCLEIVGKGPYKAKLVRLVSKLGLNNRIKFYQGLSGQELLKMYAKAGVFVLLSQREAFSIVIAEALAAKTPCVVANTSALSEWIDNKNCFGIDYPINNEELARLINNVVGKKVSAVKLWDWDEVVQRIGRLYME